MLDITFCSGSRCNRTEDCKRWTGNLEKKLRDEQIDPTDIEISVAMFADENGNCEMYLEK